MSIAHPVGVARRRKVVDLRSGETRGTGSGATARFTLVTGRGPGADPIHALHAPEASFSIAVVSGKGGVGKSSLVANLAVAMGEMGTRVLLLDGDWGLADVDQLLGLVPRHTLHDVLCGRRRADEIVLDGPAGIRVVPGGAGIEELADLDDYRRETLLRALHALVRRDEMLLIDTGSGLHRQSLRLAQSADEILLVTTPEPTALSGAAATLRALAARRPARSPRLVVNQAGCVAEAERAARCLREATARDGGAAIDLLGYVPIDETVRRSVREQRPFVQCDPDAPASRSVRALARRLLALAPSPVAPALAWGGEKAPAARLRAA
jgi:flagellar biosynthesis protein FlhG